MGIILSIMIMIIGLFITLNIVYAINEYTIDVPSDIPKISFLDFLILFRKYPYSELYPNKVVIKGIPITFNFINMIIYKHWLKKYKEEITLNELF